MKIQGKTHGASSKPFAVVMADGAEVVLTISPLPVGFAEEEERLIPQPKLPYRLARQPKTGRILRDESNNPVTVPDDQDANYLRKLLRCATARAARTVAAALREDPSVEFDTTTEDYPKEEEYFYELGNEMTLGGIGQATQTEIMRVAMELSGMNIRDAQEVAEHRFPDEQERRPERERSPQGQGQDDGISVDAAPGEVGDEPVGVG